MWQMAYFNFSALDSCFSAQLELVKSTSECKIYFVWNVVFLKNTKTFEGKITFTKAYLNATVWQILFFKPYRPIILIFVDICSLILSNWKKVNQIYIIDMDSQNNSRKLISSKLYILHFYHRQEKEYWSESPISHRGLIPKGIPSRYF